MNANPTVATVKAKMARGGALFASDEVQVLVDQTDALRDIIVRRITTAFGCPHSLLPAEIQRLAEWVVNVQPWTSGAANGHPQPDPTK